MNIFNTFTRWINPETQETIFVSIADLLEVGTPMEDDIELLNDSDDLFLEDAGCFFEINGCH